MLKLKPKSYPLYGKKKFRNTVSTIELKEM